MSNADNDNLPHADSGPEGEPVDSSLSSSQGGSDDSVHAVDAMEHPLSGDIDQELGDSPGSDEPGERDDAAEQAASDDALAARFWEKADQLRWLPRLMRYAVRRRMNEPFALATAQGIAGNDEDENAATHLPVGEHVRVPVIWLAEFFTPTTIDALTTGIGELIRKSDGTWLRSNEDPLTWIRSSRRQGGGGWHNLAYVRPGKPRLLPSRTVLDELPVGITSVHLMLNTVSTTVTVLTAAFRLNAGRAAELNGVLDKRYVTRPEPQPEGTYEIDGVWRQKERAAEEWRAKLHREAAHWLAQRFPGSLHRLAPNQIPIIELLLTENYSSWDIVANPDQIPGWAEVLDLSGWAKIHWNSIGSPQGLRLKEYTTHWVRPDDRNVLVLSGMNREITGISPGSTADEAIGMMDEMAGRLIARWGLVVLLQELDKQTSTIQDAAARASSRQSAHALSEMQRQILRTGIDSRIVVGDIVDFANSPAWKNVVDFTAATPAVLSSSSSPQPATQATFLNETWRVRATIDGKRIIEQESDLREILNTSAQLAAASANLRLQRTAVWIAVISLLVAIIAIWVSSHQSGGATSPKVHPSVSTSPRPASTPASQRKHV
jgi:hypothetical protein